MAVSAYRYTDIPGKPVEREVEIMTAEEHKAFVAREQVRRYQMAMKQPARVAPHDDEPFEIAVDPAEISELRKEVTQLRQGMARLPDLLAPRSATTSLSVELSQLRDAVTQLRQEMGEKTSVIEKSARGDSFTDFMLQTKMKALEQQVAGLRKQFQEVSESANSSGSQQEFSEPRSEPPIVQRYQPSDSKPYRYASDIEYMMRETPRAISEWEKPYDPYRDRD
ncbi:hypothetical protein [Streptomyces phaeoluteigriseus]